MSLISWSRRGKLSLVFLLLFIQGCEKERNCRAVEYKKKSIHINGYELNVEVAESIVALSCGLSKREALASNSGMLFVFDKPGNHAFWMKGVSIPLSVAFVDVNKRIINTHNMDTSSLTKYYPQGNALYAIEANWGWFDERGIKAGDSVVFSLNH